MHYLAIGHIAKDISPQGWVLGGTVTYSARMAQALGYDVTVITSCEDKVDLSAALPHVNIIRRSAGRTTTFENIYTAAGRIQKLHAVADPLTFDLVPKQSSPDIVHLAPIAQEVNETWIERFPDALIGVTPQGWLRQWDAAGQVHPIAWANAEHVLRHASATVISIEDVNGDESIVQHWASVAPVLVVTRGGRGCTVFVAGRPAEIPAPKVMVVDTTGAGDIFATAFFVRLRESGDPIMAGRFANCIAAHSITRTGPDSVPTRNEIEDCLVRA